MRTHDDVRGMFRFGGGSQDTRPTGRRSCALALLGLLGVAAPGCEEDDDDDACSDEVESYTAAGFDPATVATFYVLTDADYAASPVPIPPDVMTGITAANTTARNELINLGLTPVARDVADVSVFSVALSEEMTGYTWECVPGYVWGWWTYYWSPCAWYMQVPFEYTVGTLLVGIADEATQTAQFGGAMQGVLECGDVTARVTSGVQEIFADYPVPPV